MTVNEVCKHFDRSQIVDKLLDVDREYFASTDAIYSNGDVKYHVNSDGCIHITSAQNASYIIFLDREDNTCLCVYKHIPEITCKYIMENLTLLKEAINRNDDSDFYDDTKNEFISSDLIDINTFSCTECSSKEKLTFKRSKGNPDILETKCDKCKTEYTFTPSKYYKLASKKIIYFTSEDSSRLINIK